MFDAEFASNNARFSATLASFFLSNYGQYPQIRFKPSEPLLPYFISQT